MATEHAMATMERDANDRIVDANATLSKLLAIEIPDAPAERLDARMTQIRMLERHADVLEAIAAKVGRLKNAKAIDAQLQTVIAERDEALEAATAVKQNEATTQQVQDTLNRIVYAAADHPYLRTALVELGVIQAKQDDGGSDWSVSVIGLGPNLFAEPAPDAEVNQPSQPPDEVASESSSDADETQMSEPNGKEA